MIQLPLKSWDYQITKYDKCVPFAHQMEDAFCITHNGKSWSFNRFPEIEACKDMWEHEPSQMLAIQSIDEL